jgi:uncharacterized protein (DUF427 family)
VKTSDNKLKMIKVYLDGVLIAQAENPPVVEGNYYFPPSAIEKEYFKDSNTQ